MTIGLPVFAYSTTTLKQIYSDRCICTSDARILGFGVYCDAWNCTGSTTEQVIVNDFGTTTYATITNASLNTSSTILNWPASTTINNFPTSTRAVISEAIATFPYYSATITSASSTILISSDWSYAELFLGFLATTGLILIILKWVFGFFYPSRVRIQRKDDY